MNLLAKTPLGYQACTKSTLELPMPTTLSLRALVGAAVLLAPSVARAATFSFGDDWSGSVNPHAGYTYGMAANTTAPVTAFTLATAPLTGVEAWSVPGLPWVTKNTTGSDIAGGSANYLAAPTHFLGAHPGPSGEYAVISYALPLTGTLGFTADFNSQDNAGATTDVHIFLDGTELFSGNVIGIGSTLSYATPGGGLAVTAGDVLEVRLGTGGGAYFNDTTGVKVEGNITAVPEPAETATWFAAALVAGGLWLRRQRR